MPWKTEWFDAGETVLLFQAVHPLDWAEIAEGIQRGQVMIREKGYVVDVIVLLEDVKLPGPNILQPMRGLYGGMPRNTGIKVVVSAPTLVQTFINILTSVMGGTENFHFVKTLDDARAELEKAQSARGAAQVGMGA